MKWLLVLGLIVNLAWADDFDELYGLEEPVSIPGYAAPAVISGFTLSADMLGQGSDSLVQGRLTLAFYHDISSPIGPITWENSASISQFGKDSLDNTWNFEGALSLYTGSWITRHAIWISYSQTGDSLQYGAYIGINNPWEFAESATLEPAAWLGWSPSSNTQGGASLYISYTSKINHIDMGPQTGLYYRFSQLSSNTPSHSQGKAQATIQADSESGAELLWNLGQELGSWQWLMSWGVGYSITESVTTPLAQASASWSF